MKKYDNDSDNFLSYEEYDWQFGNTMSDFDKNHDDKIDIEEFKDFYNYIY